MNEPWRRLALLLLLFGMVGVLLELFLLEHYEEAQQRVPMVLLGIGPVLAAVALVRPGRLSVRSLQLLMATYLIAGLLGIFFHLKSNIEFELEMRPTMAGAELVWESLRGAMPALAPGTMFLLGLLGLLACYQHPAVRPTQD